MTILRPRDVIHIRLSLGLTQREFSQRLNVSQGMVDHLENGRIKHISPNLQKLLEQLTKGISLIDTHFLNNKKLQLQARGRFFGERAKKSGKRGGMKGGVLSITSRSPTLQENQIISALKSKGIPYQHNAPIKYGFRTFVVDFAIPDGSNPSLLIEAKDLSSSYRKYLPCVELAWRIIQLRKKFTHVLFYIFIKGDFYDSEIEIVKSEADKVFLNENPKKLAAYIKHT